MFNFRFVQHRKIAFIISLVIIVVGIISLLTQGLNVGIDFTGGTRVHLNIGEEFSVDEVRQVLDPFELEGIQVQKVGELEGGQEVILKTPLLTEEERQAVIGAFQDRYPGMTNDDILAIENVGPTIGEELRQQAYLALAVAMVGMIIYITLRFEFRFAIAAIIALFHDAMVVLTVFSLLQIEVNSPFVAAILTIIGYSINDTIVLFDRMRENIKGRSKTDTVALVNRSINQTLVRSLNTSLTTLLVMSSLFFLGGAPLQPFILALLIGVVTGTYSSIFIASQVWFSWKALREGGQSTKTA